SSNLIDGRIPFLKSRWNDALFWSTYLINVVFYSMFSLLNICSMGVSNIPDILIAKSRKAHNYLSPKK
ncbi:hypothetical protein AALB39_28715, partial [Lachnospiraceae bacterium 54-53]